MTEATRQALQRIDAILHEAGWDQLPAAPASPLRPDDRARLRRACEILSSRDQRDIPEAIGLLQAVLGELSANDPSAPDDYDAR